MKINSKGLSIPPYISTSWDNVISLQYDEASLKLVVLLKGGSKITVPGLSGEALDLIFSSHAEYLDHSGSGSNLPIQGGNLFGVGIAPGSLTLEGVGNLSGMMQHDSMQKETPPLPKQLLDKLADVTKALGLDLSAFQLPESEPHCNCPFCQITRAMNGVSKENTIEQLPDEPVSDKELQFREWDIEKIGDKLYNVSRPLDKAEKYQVFLGHPVGCTCGKNACEHIVAVLNS